MPSNRHNLILDEEAFQGLLAAAFIVQEYSDRQKNDPQKYDRLEWARQQLEAHGARPPATSGGVCLQCGTRKPDGESLCQSCGRDELRPGERLQHNWASMWLISKEHDPGTLPPPRAASDEANGEAMDEMTDDRTENYISHEDLDLVRSPGQLAASHDSSPDESVADEAAGWGGDHDGGDHGNGSFIGRLTNLRLRLRFHRSNLYLIGAVIVAILALLWPAAGSPRRATLSPWERLLVTIGVAEAPAPAVHLQGDPAIEVWIDPHTALYYCPGEEQYGKTADGRFSSQREAQMDRFEPAGRSTCE